MKKSSPLIWLLSISIASAQIPAPGGPHAMQLQNEAASYYRQGRYQESAHLFRKLLEAQPENTEVLKDYMWASWKAGDWKQAVDAASKIAAINPHDVEALSVLAKASESYGEIESAIESYKKILNANPTDAQAKVALAGLYANRGKLVEAETLLSKAAQEAPGDKNIYPTLAKIQASRGAHIEAAQTWERAAQQTPGRSEYKFQQAKALYGGKRTADALVIYRQLLLDRAQKRRALDALVNHAADHNQTQRAAELLETNLADTDEEGDENRLMRLAWLYQEMGQMDNSLETLNRLLQKSPQHPKALMLKADYLYEFKRDYKGTEEAYLEALKQIPNEQKIYPRLAMAQFLQGSYKASAESWTKAVQMNPTRSDYKFKQAEALYLDKQHDEAIKIFTQLLKDPKENLHALDFLVGDKFAQGDIRGAAALLEKNPLDGSRFYRLASFYINLGKTRKSLQVIDKYLALHPNDMPAWMLKAFCLSSLGKEGAVLRIYEKLHEANPTSVFIYTRLFESQYNAGKKGPAIKSVGETRKMDPTNPYLLIREAAYRYDDGQYEKAKKLVKDWLAKNTPESLPVFMYHGLASSTRNPMLLHPYHMTTAVFEDQMRALKEAGFNAVTIPQIIAWQKGDSKLSAKPVLITFDDARLDSFKNADPILKKYGLKATMFTIVENVERSLPNYANWEQINAYQSTGRWNIQAHGNKGHTHINVNAEGDKAFFLVRKKWLEEQNRVETNEEWRTRTLEDYQSNQTILAEKVGNTPTAFAFPEGNFGQYNLTSFPTSQMVTKVARQVFNICFHEDDHGINLRSRDPGLMTRYMPGQTQRGVDLVRFVMDETPHIVANRMLLKWSLWEDKPREAYEWLNEMKKGGASEYCLLVEEARIHAAKGNLTRAEHLLKTASSLGGPDYDNEKKKPFVVPSQQEMDPVPVSE